jgi:catechol 2,3-dioxygenase-like lactoylglutathione lyase family enzyme
MLDHVILTVKDFKRSVPFYQQVLRTLEITEFVEYWGNDGHPDLKGFGRDNTFFFWLKEGNPDPSAVHVGFKAKSQAEVNTFFHVATAVGAGIKTPPAVQHQYHRNYYATWVIDPDGHDIEVVNKTGQVE